MNDAAAAVSKIFKSHFSAVGRGEDDIRVDFLGFGWRHLFAKYFPGEGG